MERMDVDLVAPDLYAGDPYPTYAWMRANEPVYWDGVNELWGIARYDDVIRIEKDKETFISSDTEKGGYRPNIPADAAIIGLDDPMHLKRRQLVSRRFTPRAAGAWEDDIRDKVVRILDRARSAQSSGGSVEIVSEMAAPLPAMMIGKLLGFDEARWPDLKHWSETTIALGRRSAVHERRRNRGGDGVRRGMPGGVRRQAEPPRGRHPEPLHDG